MFATHKEPVNKLPPASTVSPVNLPGKETNEISRETESTVGFSSGLNELFTGRPVVSQGRRACGKEGRNGDEGGEEGEFYTVGNSLGFPVRATKFERFFSGNDEPNSCKSFKRSLPDNFLPFTPDLA